MSAGVVHTKASIILATSLLACAVFGGHTFPSALGALVGTFITPDLDVDNGFIGDEIIGKFTGKIGRQVWVWFWTPYKTACKHGRFMSHFPIFSTFVRLLYLYFFLVFMPHIAFWVLVRPVWNLEYALKWYAELLYHPLFFLGLAYSDTIHYFLDLLTTEHAETKRATKKSWFRKRKK